MNPNSKWIDQKIQGTQISEVLIAIKSGRAIIFVEGSSDIRCFEKMINKNKCQLLEVDPFKKILFYDYNSEKNKQTKGKYNRTKVLEIVRDYREKMKTELITGIIDSDFYVDDNQKPVNQVGIFKTDTHDLENLILKSDVFLTWIQEIIQESLSQEQKNNLSISFSDEKNSKIKKHLLICALWLAIYRAVRDKNYSCPAFRDESCVFSNFITLDADKSPSFSLKDFIDLITDKYPEDKKKLKKEMIKKHEKHADKEDEWLWKICHGHDLTKILQVFIVKNYIREIPSDYCAKFYTKKRTEIEETLIDLYSLEFFKKTNLFHEISSWKSDIFKDPVTL